MFGDNPLLGYASHLSTSLKLPSLGGSDQPKTLSPQEEDSVLRKAGKIGMSGISAVGSLLDLPGSMVRDTLMGLGTGDWTKYNPLDQILSPLSGENRAHPEDIMEGLGFLTPEYRKENPFKSMLWSLPAAIVTDPLTYISGGSTAATKLGELARAGNLEKHIAPAVAAKFQNPLADVGSGFARKTATFGDVLKRQAATDDVLERIATTGLSADEQVIQDLLPHAKKLGLSEQEVRNAGNERLYGSLKIGIPFADAKTVIGAAPVEREVPDWMRYVTGEGVFPESGTAAMTPTDMLLRTAKYAKIPFTNLAPVNELSRTFVPSLKQTVLPTGQTAAQRLFESQGEAAAAARTLTAKEISELSQISDGLFTQPRFNDDLRMIAEKFDPTDVAAAHLGWQPETAAAFPQLKKVYQSAWDDIDKLKARADKIGMDIPTLSTNPTTGEYFPRHVAAEYSEGTGRSSKIMKAAHESQSNRMEFATGVNGGTVKIERILRDPDLKNLIDVQNASKEDVATFLQQKYSSNPNAPDYIDPLYISFREARREKRNNRLIDSLQNQDLALEAANVPPTDPRRLKIVKDIDRLTAKPTNRWEKMGEWVHGLSTSPEGRELRDSGFYTNSPFHDLQRHREGLADAIGAGETVLDTLAQDLLQNGRNMSLTKNPSAMAGRQVTVGEILSDAKLKLGNDSKGALKELAQRAGLPVDKASLRALSGMTVDARRAEDLGRLMEGYTRPDSVNKFVQLFDKMQATTKAFLTSPFAAFQVRNVWGGQFNNWIGGMFSLKSIQDSVNVMKGGVIKDAATFPEVIKEAARRGITGKLSEREATDIVKQLAYGHKVVDKYNSLGVAGGGGSGSVGDMLSGIIGQNPFDAKQHAKEFFFMDGGTPLSKRLNPFETRSGFTDATKTSFGPLKAGEAASYYTEGLNRFSPFIHELRNGSTAAEAARRVGAAQVLYDSRHYTPTEREIMTRAFPFFKYTSRQIPYNLRQLVEQPGGRLAQVVKATARQYNPDALTPDYIAQTVSAPMGTTPTGDKRFFTAGGLPFEDMMQFFGGRSLIDPLEAGRELMSRVTPVGVKPMIEALTGQSFFQRGPMGGRALEDMDPLVGRTLTNMWQTMQGVGGHMPAVKLPQALELLAANGPTSRILSSLRTAFDPRKDLLTKAMNLGTGLRISDMSPAAQEALIRERGMQLMKKAGAKDFTRVYFPKEVVAKMPAEQQHEAMVLNTLQNVLAKRAKQRASQPKTPQERHNPLLELLGIV